MNQPIAGVWELWVWDASGGDSGAVTADQDIVVERAMYWPGGTWQEAHNALGAEPALRWGLADVRGRAALALTVPPSEAAHAFGAGLMSAEVEVLNYQPIAVEKAMYWNADGLTWAGGSAVTASRLPPR